MAHIYVRSQSIFPGVEMEISGHPIDAGDKIPVEFPNNNRAEATVMGSGDNVLEIKVGDGQWRLAPTEPAELLVEQRPGRSGDPDNMESSVVISTSAAVAGGTPVMSKQVVRS